MPKVILNAGLSRFYNFSDTPQGNKKYKQGNIFKRVDFQHLISHHLQRCNKEPNVHKSTANSEQTPGIIENYQLQVLLILKALNRFFFHLRSNFAVIRPQIGSWLKQAQKQSLTWRTDKNYQNSLRKMYAPKC